MKKLIFMVGILISNISMAGGNPPLKSEITDKLILDLSEVVLDADQQDFVEVSFYICDGEIKVEGITGTQKELVEKVNRKLSKLKIEQDYEEGVLYQYKFTFEKG